MNKALRRDGRRRAVAVHRAGIGKIESLKDFVNRAAHDRQINRCGVDCRSSLLLADAVLVTYCVVRFREQRAAYRR